MAREERAKAKMAEKGKGKDGKTGGGRGTGKGNAQEHFNGECSYCGIWGHKRAQCRKLQAAKAKGDGRHVGQLGGQLGEYHQSTQQGVQPPPQAHPQLRPDRASTQTSLASTAQIGSLHLCSLGCEGDAQVCSVHRGKRVRIGVDSGQASRYGPGTCVMTTPLVLRQNPGLDSSMSQPARAARASLTLARGSMTALTIADSG